jgi:hypothetical protein
MYVQPVWIGWTLPHFDVAFGLGFTAPTGRYIVEEATLPRTGTIKVEDTCARARTGCCAIA